VDKKFLVIQLRPEDITSDSEFNAILKAGNLDIKDTERIRGEHGFSDIDLSKYSGIIVGGSPYDITTPDNEKSESQKNVESSFNKLFDKVIKQDFPFIGACSGNGLLGNYCGANISRKYGETVQAVDLTITKEGLNDPILKGVTDPFRGLVGHKEACDAVPPSATLLVTGDTCPTQMFRVGKNVYATQFHPEADVEEFVVRINIYKNNGYFPAENAENLINELRKNTITEPKKILKNFVDRYSN
jgi:GMP synthase (glutamine-hydrolysing)